MYLRPILAAFCVVVGLSAAFADHTGHPDGMHIHDAYARIVGGAGGSGSVYFMIHNNSGVDDRLLGVSSDTAARTMLHSQTEDANGVMQMRAMDEGLPLPAGEMRELVRGGDHIMLMGTALALRDGDTITLTLTFERADEMVIEVPVDNARKSGDAGDDHVTMDHDAMDHDAMGHDEPAKE